MKLAKILRVQLVVLLNIIFLSQLPIACNKEDTVSDTENKTSNLPGEPTSQQDDDFLVNPGEDIGANNTKDKVVTGGCKIDSVNHVVTLYGYVNDITPSEMGVVCSPTPDFQSPRYFPVSAYDLGSHNRRFSATITDFLYDTQYYYYSYVKIGEIEYKAEKYYSFTVAFHPDIASIISAAEDEGYIYTYVLNGREYTKLSDFEYAASHLNEYMMNWIYIVATPIDGNEPKVGQSMTFFSPLSGHTTVIPVVVPGDFSKTVNITVRSSAADPSDPSDPVYGVSSWYSKDSIVGGSHYLFRIEARAAKGTLTEMNISSYDPIQGLRDLVRVPLSGTKYTYEYDYLVPIFPDSVIELQLRVQIKNSLGDTWKGTKYLKVFESDYRLKEITGLLIYEQPTINRPNALNFMGGGAQPIVTTVEEKDSIKNLIAYYDPQTGDAMSKAFYTKSQEKNYNVYMAKMSNFDYAGATYKSVRNAFQNTADLGRSVTDLKQGDIIIVGLLDRSALWTPLAVVRIVRILDEAGKENDCYELCVKTMQRQ